jgi:hypothetical protein
VYGAYSAAIRAHAPPEAAAPSSRVAALPPESRVAAEPAGAAGGGDAAADTSLVTAAGNALDESAFSQLDTSRVWQSVLYMGGMLVCASTVMFGAFVVLRSRVLESGERDANAEASEAAAAAAAGAGAGAAPDPEMELAALRQKKEKMRVNRAKDS